MKTALTSSTEPYQGQSFGPQFTLFDIETDWVRTTLVKDLRQPENWSATGHDYLNGDHFVRLEIFEKPTDIEIMMQTCLWSGINEMCAGWHSSVSFSRPGIYYAKITTPYSEWILREAHQGNRTAFDGEGKLTQALIQWWVDNPTIKRGKSVLRTVEHGGVGAGRAESLGPEAFRHIPIRYRMEYVLVAKGHELTPPEHWSDAPERGSPDWDFYSKSLAETD